MTAAQTLAAQPSAAASLAALIVEDNPTDVLLLEQALGTHIRKSAHASTLEQCLSILKRERFDVILLDLGLEDSEGLDTFRAVRAAVPDTAIVVLTGLEDEEVGIAALQCGAQEYICKGQKDPSSLLARVIRYSVERHRLAQRVDIERQSQEMRSVERLSENHSTAITSSMYGGHTLRERAPEVFLDLFDRYRELLEMAVEERTFKTERSTLEDDLRAICQSIASHRGSPRDVIEIHLASLKGAMEHAPSTRSRVYAEEGRILVLELMGYLAGFYRHYYPGTRSQPTSTPRTIERFT